MNKIEMINAPCDGYTDLPSLLSYVCEARCEEHDPDGR